MANDRDSPVVASAALSEATRRPSPLEVQRIVPNGSVSEPDGRANPISSAGDWAPSSPAMALMSAELTASGATLVGANTVVLRVAAAATPANTAPAAATVTPVPAEVPMRRQ